MSDPASSSLLVVGVNHRTAPVAIREEVAFDQQQLPQALAELKSLPGVRGAVILSTCNRTELYCDVSTPGADEPAKWLAAHRGLSDAARDALYILEGRAAVRHVFCVACGLDSMVLGEPQILGQAKNAYATAHEMGAAGPLLNLLFQQAFAVAKQVRTDTRIGASPVSIASTAVSLAREIFSQFSRHSALLIGAGDTIELTARHLHANGVGRMIIANRSVERARGLALQFDAYAISLSEIPAHLAEADLLISSTASPEPIIDSSIAQAAIKARRRKPMFMVDLAIPRDIDPAVSALEDVYLYTLDDLNEVITRNQNNREQAADEARDMIDEATEGFERLLAARDTVPVIRQLREQSEQLRDQCIDEARQMLSAGQDPDKVLGYLANRLTARLLHSPTLRLRQAGEQAEAQLRYAAEQLFGLGDDVDNDRD